MEKMQTTLEFRAWDSGFNALDLGVKVSGVSG